MTLVDPVLRHEPDGPPGLVLWGVTLGGIAAWTVHVLAAASIVPYAENHGWAFWVVHALTIALAAFTLVLTVWSVHIARTASTAESRLSPAGRTAFVGWLGAAMNAANLLLIVVEGIFVAVLHSHA